jgi:hypothetical protein
MVLMNASNKSRQQQSIQNRNTGGGDKKAGLVPTQTKNAATLNISYKNRGLPRPMSFMMNPKVSKTAPSRPTGMINVKMR